MDTKNNNQDENIENTIMSDEDLRKLILKPLADPVVEAIFANEDVAGLAAQSLVNAVLEMDGDPPMGEIIRLTAQKTSTNLFSRSFRLDIEGLANGELCDIEVQLNSMRMTDRAFLYAGQLAGINAKRGDTMPQVLKKMPRILMININWFEVRPDHPDFTQPVDLMYRKPSPKTNKYELASDRVHIYNVDVSNFMENVLQELKEKPYDPAAPKLFYWLWALGEAQTSGKSLLEVIQLSAALQEHVKNDKGFSQYTERYEEVSDDMAVRRQFAIWTNERDILESVRAEGEKSKAIKAARNLLSLGIAPELIAKGVELPLEKVLALKPTTPPNENE